MACRPDTGRKYEARHPPHADPPATNGGERIVLSGGRYAFWPDRHGDRTTAFAIRARAD
jgi:hypothetical protein